MKQQPLDPREAARRFREQAKHNWRAALVEAVHSGAAADRERKAS